MNRKLVKEAITLLEKVTGKKVVLEEGYTKEELEKYDEQELKGLRIKGEYIGRPGVFLGFKKNALGNVQCYFDEDKNGSRWGYLSLGNKHIKFY